MTQETLTECWGQKIFVLKLFDCVFKADPVPEVNYGKLLHVSWMHPTNKSIVDILKVFNAIMYST